MVFGTSLSDSGNAFALRGSPSTPPDDTLDPLLVPSAPYARGGHHFSNGATWIEQLARSWGLAGSVRLAFASASPFAINYAVAAGGAYDDGLNFNLADQVQAFFADHGGTASCERCTSSRWAATTSGMRSWRSTGGFAAAQTVLAELSALPGITIRRLDAFSLLHAIVDAPQTYGLSNVTRACVRPDVPPFFCQRPDVYLF